MAGPIGRRALVRGGLATGAVLATPGRRARAAAATITIGVLTDLNGPNSDDNGEGSVVGTKLAAEDFMGAHSDVTVKVLEADYQSKPDVAIAIGRDWIDRQGVDVISNVNNSAAALAIAGLVRERNKVALLTGPASSDLTGKACSPNHVHWVYDTWALGNCTGRTLVSEGGNSWFFIAADYTFGHLLASDTAHFVTAAGGRVLGTVYTPFPETTDFSSYLVQAQASGARIIGLANSGANTVDCVKQAAEFGVTRNGTRLAALLLMIADVHAIGLATAQGLVLSESFYWDTDAGTRAYAKRFAARRGGQMPTMIQAGDYSAVTHYLKAASAMGVAQAKASGRAAVAQMKAMPTDDPLFGPGSIRADGRKLTPMHLFQVKSPAESRYPWDYYKLLRTIPADQAFRPMADGGCSLVHA